MERVSSFSLHEIEKKKERKEGGWVGLGPVGA